MESKKVSKRVNLVSVKLIKEGSILYEPRRISSPKDAFELGKEFLIDSDREKLILVCLDNKNQPTSINTVSVGSLNSSIVHPREVFKVAILSSFFISCFSSVSHNMIHFFIMRFTCFMTFIILTYPLFENTCARNAVF